MKYALIAEYNDIYQEYIGESFKDHWSEEIVALFDDESKANQYIKDSKLKVPKKKTFSSEKPFKNKSLLSRATYGRVEPFGNPDYPLNPEL